MQVLPPELGTIEQVRKITLMNNPFMKELDMEARKGTASLLNYLRGESYDAVYFQFVKENKMKAEGDDK